VVEFNLVGVSKLTNNVTADVLFGAFAAFLAVENENPCLLSCVLQHLEEKTWNK
jgi:hypothetical protein